jgi:outer membrane receptor protein involved in Fe transport
MGDTDVSGTTGPVGFVPFPREFTHQHAYTYTNINFPRPVTWTLGASYDDFEDLPVEVKKVNPKLGVRWDLTPDLSIRGAYFQWVKPPLIADRTLEPTQVSGFNQVFDNSNGDQAEHRALGLDWRLTKQLFTGA